MSLIDRLKQLGNPIDWSETEKTLLGIGHNFCLFVLFFSIVGLTDDPGPTLCIKSDYRHAHLALLARQHDGLASFLFPGVPRAQTPC